MQHLDLQSFAPRPAIIRTKAARCVQNAGCEDLALRAVNCLEALVRCGNAAAPGHPGPPVRPPGSSGISGDYPLVMTNITIEIIENHHFQWEWPFIVDFPIKHGDFP